MKSKSYDYWWTLQPSLTATSGEKSGKKFCSSMVWSLGSFWPPGSQGLILTASQACSVHPCTQPEELPPPFANAETTKMMLCSIDPVYKSISAVGICKAQDLRSLKTHWELRSSSTSGRFVLSSQVSCYSYSPRGAALPPKGCQSQPGQFDMSWSSPAISSVPPPWSSGLAFWNRKDLHPKA